MRREPSARHGAAISEICQQILGFLADHPEAQDTAEGITAWWLLERDLERERGTVEEALSRLVDRGLLVEKRGADGRTRFPLAPDRRQEVSRLANGGGR